MLASELCACLRVKKIVGDITDVHINYLSQNTKDIVANTLFVCVEGTQVDGHRFAKQAKEAGAVLFLASKDISEQVGQTPVVYVKDVMRAMAILASVFYQKPSQRMYMVGVTGTNGKTSVTHLLEYLLQTQDEQVGLIGTAYRKIGERIVPTKNTTPDALTLQKTFSEMLDVDTQTCVMEVSSHALALGRVWQTKFDCAIFTNLTHEHLEFHKTMENYAQAKGLLFAQLGHDTNKYAVLNSDDAYARVYADMTAAQVFTYGITDEQAGFRAVDIQTHGMHTTFVLQTAQQDYFVEMPLIGLFNVYNVLAALCAFYIKYPEQLVEAIAALKVFKGLPGRMQLVDKGQNYKVIIDFAHTPDGLANVLTTLAQINHQRIITVIGHSGGNRDASMRPELGRLALQQSDFVVFTADNPRNEPLQKIYQELIGTCQETNYITIDDRYEAIAYALSMASADDIVLLAGKGVEDYQVIGDTYVPYSELAVVENYFNQLGEEK